MPLDDDVCRAARALARHRLVTAFGHVSARDGDAMVITGPRPLALAAARECQRVPLDADQLPDGTPKEAWMHLAIYRARSDVGAIARAQPEVTTALGSASVAIRPLHGQGSFCGPEVAVFPEAELVRDLGRAQRLAQTLGFDRALVLKGNGALTTGDDPGQAMARMWVLEASARINATAAGAGSARPISTAEQQSWCAVERELLSRLWQYLNDAEEAQ